MSVNLPAQSSHGAKTIKANVELRHFILVETNKGTTTTYRRNKTRNTIPTSILFATMSPSIHKVKLRMSAVVLD